MKITLVVITLVCLAHWSTHLLANGQILIGSEYCGPQIWKNLTFGIEQNVKFHEFNKTQKTDLKIKCNPQNWILPSLNPSTTFGLGNISCWLSKGWLPPRDNPTSNTWSTKGLKICCSNDKCPVYQTSTDKGLNNITERTQCLDPLMLQQSYKGLTSDSIYKHIICFNHEYLTDFYWLWCYVDTGKYNVSAYCAYDNYMKRMMCQCHPDPMPNTVVVPVFDKSNLEQSTMNCGRKDGWLDFKYDYNVKQFCQQYGFNNTCPVTPGQACPVCETKQCPSQTDVVCPTTNACPTCVCVTPEKNLANHLTVTVLITVINLGKQAFGLTTVKKHSFTNHGKKCHMFCHGRWCSGSDGCKWWCDGKENRTGQCKHMCFVTEKNHVECLSVPWTLTDEVSGYVEIVENVIWLTFFLTFMCFIFWLCNFKIYLIFFWMLKCLMFFQPRGKPVHRGAPKFKKNRYVTRFSYNGNPCYTSNVCLMLLLCIITFGHIRPSRAIVIGPEDFGRTFENGTLGFQVDRTYDWHNLTSHGGQQACRKSTVDCWGNFECCSTSCDGPGLNNDCTYKVNNTICGSGWSDGGGWPQGCLCLGSNRMSCSCSVKCDEIINVFYLGNPTGFYSRLKLTLGGNTTTVFFNQSGTSTVKVGKQNVKVTISGCGDDHPDKVGWFKTDYKTPPMDVNNCPLFKDGYLQDHCNVDYGWNYNGASCSANNPPPCRGNFLTLAGKRSEHGYEHYKKCDYNFGWTEEKCEPDSTGTIVGCRQSVDCIIIWKNCTKCCYNGRSKMPGQLYYESCFNCTWNGTYYGGPVLNYTDYNKGGISMSNSKEVGWQNFLRNTWTNLVNWFYSWSYLGIFWLVLIIIGIIIVLLLLCKK